MILFPPGATRPPIGEADEVVTEEPLGVFNSDPTNLVMSTGGRFVVNHLLEHDYVCEVELDSLLEDIERVPITGNAPTFNAGPPVVGSPKDGGARCIGLW